jgi:hypothetical protein
MWTYERFISILNQYVVNHAYPEGPMIEVRSTKEIIQCCLGYLKDKVGIGLVVPCFLEVGRGWHNWEENFHRQGFQRCNKHNIASCSISR